MVSSLLASDLQLPLTVAQPQACLPSQGATLGRVELICRFPGLRAHRLPSVSVILGYC